MPVEPVNEILRTRASAIQVDTTDDASVVVVSAAPVLVPAAHGIGPIDPVDPPEFHREQLGHAKAVLDHFGIGAEYDLGVGDPADVIVAAAEERDADMIVVGTNEPGLISRLLGLSVSEKVQRRAHCDVLVVR